MSDSAEKDAPRRAELATWFRSAADRCCQCTDGHHDWTPDYPYGTDGDVRVTRDLAREVADLLDGTRILPPERTDS